MTAAEATSTCEHCAAPIEMRNSFWSHADTSLISCDQSVPLWQSRHAWPRPSVTTGASS